MNTAASRIQARRLAAIRAALAAGEMTWAEICREFSCSKRQLVLLSARPLDTGTSEATYAFRG